MSIYGREITTGRRVECFIVDEVDSMLLDKGDATLYLSHEIPELDHLKSLFVNIWRVTNQEHIFEAVYANDKEHAVELIIEKINQMIKDE